MAGKQWMVYTADDGKDYAVMLSKDIIKAGKLGFRALSNMTTPLLPSGMKMRYVRAVLTNGTGKGFIRRSFPVAKNTEPIFKAVGPTSLNYNGQSFETTSKRGEKRRFATPFDTGI